MFDFSKEYPMPNYKASWRIFRESSDENEVTAAHILGQPNWPRHDGITILDIGCGDGYLVRSILLQASQDVAEVRLLDPDPEFLSKATTHINEWSAVRRVVDIPMALSPASLPDYTGVNCILMVHVVYLLPDATLQSVISGLPPGVRLYIVLDEPDSIFTQLWQQTAPKYAKRSAEAHATIEALNEGEFAVYRSTVTSHLRNPLRHRRSIRDKILSMLCYAELSDISDHRKNVIIDAVACRIADDMLPCSSACYEIVRK